LKSIFILSFLAFLMSCVTLDLNAQNKDFEFEQEIDSFFEARPLSFNDINKSLSQFRRDTTKLYYLLDRSELVEYPASKAYVLHQLGSYYVHTSEYDKGENKLNQSLDITKEHDFKELTARNLNMLGVANRRRDKMLFAIDYHQEALQTAEKIKNPSNDVKRSIATSINSIGNCYLILEQWEQSIPMFKRAMEIEKSVDNNLGIAINYQNIGYALEKLDSLDQAIPYYEKSLAHNEIIDSDIGRVICKNSLAQVQIKKGNYQLAKNLLQPLIPIITATSDKFHTAFVLVNYGWANMELGQLDIAREYLEQARDISSEHNLQYSKVEAYKLLSELESKTGNYQKALEDYKISKEQQLKVLNTNTLQYINDLAFKYESEKKNTKIIELAKDNEIVKLKLAQNNKIYLIILVVSLLTGSIYFAYSRQKQKRKDQEILSLKREHQIKTLETLIQGEEKERNRIAKELHDGLNGDLSAIKYKLSNIFDNNNHSINEVIGMIDRSCQQVRTISHNLLPPSLETFNLIEAVQNLISSMDQNHEEDIDFNFIGENVIIDKKSEVNIYRIIQELVNNSIKHAEAKEINVQISHRDNLMHVSVEDDGKGFNMKSDSSKGIGIINIKSRLQYLGAQLDFNSNEEGTSYIIELNTSDN